MKFMTKTVVFIAIMLMLSNLSMAQDNKSAINFLIKTGDFHDFYGPGDVDDYSQYKSSLVKSSANKYGIDDSGAYFNVFYEIEVAENITVSPAIGADIGFDWFMLGARADYYFDGFIPNLPEELDLWGGADSGFIIGLDGDKFMINGHAGGEWRFHENWGALVEGGFGSIGGSFGIGIAYHLN